MGDIEIIDLQDYLIVVHLDHLKYWFNPSAEPLWLDAEKGINKTTNLSSLLYAGEH